MPASSRVPDGSCRRRAVGAFLALALAGCTARATEPPSGVEPREAPPPPVEAPPPVILPVIPPTPAGEPPPPAPPPDADVGMVRIALASRAPATDLSATGGWRLYERGGRSVVVHAAAGERWTVERLGRAVRAVRMGGARTGALEPPLLARADGEGSLLTVGGRRYRGDVVVTPSDSGLLVVNHLPVESYLRGVVPLEIGDRPAGDEAAVAAQAVAARSYTYARLADLARGRPREWDLIAGVGDQVYGGAEAERPTSDHAVTLTENLVLRYAGRIANAVYSSTCGGSTAEAHELWQTDGEPYLQRVSDLIPGTDRYYCDLAPRFRWARTFDARSLASSIDTYLRAYAAVTGAIGTVRSLEVERRTASGRVGTLAIVTDRARHTLRGNNMRYVLRAPGGEILESTYFSLDPTVGPDGRLTRIVISGTGYGHGVGMCQWGAIGRARAGHDFRSILSTYYPGTTLEAVR